MPTFRKKPIDIEAFQWSGRSDQTNIPEWLFKAVEAGDVTFDDPTTGDGNDGRIRIVTLEGVMYADTDDFVIQGIKGEIYPCKPDIFEATYERIS